MNNEKRDEIILEIYGEVKAMSPRIDNIEKELKNISKEVFGDDGLITKANNNKAELKEVNKHITNCQISKKFKITTGVTIVSAVAAVGAAIATIVALVI